jgi:hypothetical protein
LLHRATHSEHVLGIQNCERERETVNPTIASRRTNGRFNHLDDRRRSARIPAKQLPVISANFVGGPAVRLVDLSLGGALVRSQKRILHRDNYRLCLRPEGATLKLEARIVRSAIVGLSRDIVEYSYSLAFADALGQDDPVLRDLLSKADARDVAVSGNSRQEVKFEHPLFPYLDPHMSTAQEADETVDDARIEIARIEIDMPFLLDDPELRQALVMNRW